MNIIRSAFSLVLMFSLAFVKTNGQTYTSSPGATIPDNNCDLTNEFELSVPLNTIMSSSLGIEKVCINITHPFIEDLSISLISPANTIIQLVINYENGVEDFTNTCFDGVGLDGSILGSVSPSTGSYLPEESLGILNESTENAMGTWKLRICDDGLLDEGTLESFSITFSNTPVPPPPLNDECSGAKSIPVSVDTTCLNTISGTILSATASPETHNCPDAGLFNNDVWFVFVANTTSQDIVVTNISGTTNELDFQVSSGSCGSLSEHYCYFDPIPSSETSFAVGGLTIGNTYFIRIAAFEAIAQNTTFDICVKKRNLPPGFNDECATATNIPVNAGLNCNQSVSGTLVNATSSTPPFSCDFNGAPVFDNDVWYSFIATQTSHAVQLSNISGFQDLMFEFLNGSCGTLTSLYCQDDPNDGFIVNNLIINHTYYIRIAAFEDGPQSSSFDICVHDAPVRPTNDDCASATLIQVSSPGCENIVSGTLEGATLSGEPESCGFGSPFQNDVWFSFVASETTHEIEISNILNPPEFMIYQLASGTCGALIQEECFGGLDPGPYTAQNLTIGDTYFFRAASLQESTNPTTFDICVKGTLAACTLIVTNNNSSGSGSLRAAIACSQPGDTIRFDATVFDQTISLDTPTIVVDHLLHIEAQNLDNITLSNGDINNTDILIAIQDQLVLSGLKIIGLTDQSMIMKVESAGGVILLNTELENTTINN